MPATLGADATEYGRCQSLPSANTPAVMYWPASNGAGSPSSFTQKLASSAEWSSRRTSVALYWGASSAMTRVSSRW